MFRLALPPPWMILGPLSLFLTVLHSVLLPTLEVTALRLSG
jgi:hypothetical protein